ncbi:hypothetical protein K227x_26010 [Rubripirellula lacrimiformis]|uniref:SF3 helicase domain-containing protein n=1 Tax=Rubripirellula lacrimiformis TaxID=1930273 RepID=A0A517NAQ3_9BACT|nr:phage/plasmid primase, P4 family [Rubripirellula lacrimiformis]QDT04211.1 hypothetical protein K227x_26010 [Rubripirellula lacrimiformis]
MSSLIERANRESVGRCGEVIAALTPLPSTVIQKGAEDHPCPVCGGDTVIWPAEGNANDHGRIACRTCTGDQPTGDVVATVAAFAGTSQGDAARRIAEFLDGSAHPLASDRSEATNDIVDRVARAKGIDGDVLRRFGATSAKRGGRDVARIPVCNELGEIHSHFDLIADPGDKGKFKQGAGNSGLFFPGKLPCPGEVWVIVEGVKDAAAVSGLGYNACGLPTSTLNEKYVRLFAGVTVILVPDLDAAGQKGALGAIEQLNGVSASTTKVQLPGPIVGKKGKDVRDVIERDGANVVQRLIDEALANKPAPKAQRTAIDGKGDQATSVEPVGPPFGSIRSTGDSWLRDSTNRNENYLATKFVDACGSEFRYVRGWHKYLVWDGKRFVVDVGDTLTLGACRRFVRNLWKSFTAIASDLTVSREQCSTVRQFCKSSNRANGIKAILELAKADDRVQISHDHLNQDPMVLNLLNGTYDLRTAKLRPHQQQDLLTQVADVEFVEDAECPRWREAMMLIFREDEGLIRYVQQILGYSLAGNPGEHILPIAYGRGCNGKSFVWNAVLKIAGDYGFVANESLLLGDKPGHPTEKASLYQKRIVAISEPERGSRMRESRVKELTGDSVITARRMHEDFWTFPRTHTFWLSTNHLPQVTGTDEAIWRRIKVIPFEVDLREHVNLVPDYHRVIVNEEGPGIFNWLMAGYRDYVRHGFVEPECVVKIGSSYRGGQDPLGSFLKERCRIDETATVSSAEIFDAYKRWGGELSKTAFGRELTDRFEKLSPRSGPYRDKVAYRGISMARSDE